MLSTSLPKDRRGRREQDEGPENPWHNFNSAKEHEQTSPSDAALELSEEIDGTWGERDTGIRSRAYALEEFE